MTAFVCCGGIGNVLIRNNNDKFKCPVAAVTWSSLICNPVLEGGVRSVTFLAVFVSCSGIWNGMLYLVPVSEMACFLFTYLEYLV